MKQEDIFAAAQAAELLRVVTCCPGVDNKLCSGDQWKGNLGPFVAEIERRAVERAIAFVEGGSFLHDDAPAARMARECAKEMRKQLLPGSAMDLTQWVSNESFVRHDFIRILEKRVDAMSGDTKDVKKAQR